MSEWNTIISIRNPIFFRKENNWYMEILGCLNCFEVWIFGASWKVYVFIYLAFYLHSWCSWQRLVLTFPPPRAVEMLHSRSTTGNPIIPLRSEDIAVIIPPEKWQLAGNSSSSSSRPAGRRASRWHTTSLMQQVRGEIYTQVTKANIYKRGDVW